MEWFKRRPERNHEKLVETYIKEHKSHTPTVRRSLWESVQGDINRKHYNYCSVYINTQKNTGEKDG